MGFPLSGWIWRESDLLESQVRHAESGRVLPGGFAFTAVKERPVKVVAQCSGRSGAGACNLHAGLALLARHPKWGTQIRPRSSGIGSLALESHPKEIVWIAIPTFQGRVSPAFDFASRLTLIRLRGRTELERREVTVVETYPGAIARSLGELRLDLLICGAISRMLEQLLRAEGLRIVSQVCGDINDVLRAFLEDRLNSEEFCLPGCHRRRADARSSRESPSKSKPWPPRSLVSDPPTARTPRPHRVSA